MEGDTGNFAGQTGVASVTKQTTETLMAGERIMEAIDLADGERAAFKEYEASMSRLSEDDAMRLQPPSRNPVLVAYDLEPHAYVLRVVEKVPNTALQDALLVLPFGKVVSLMDYLNQWAQKVCLVPSPRGLPLISTLSGVEYTACVTYNIFPTQNAPSSDCCQPHHEDFPHSPTEAFASGPTATERYHGI